MTSPALTSWRSSRLVWLDQFLAAHPHAVGSATDPTVAQQSTHALVLLLAGQFQGFCRDLYDDAVQAILDSIGPSNRQMRVVLANCLLLDRGLDRRGADPRTIRNDFARLGSDLGLARASGGTPAWVAGIALLHRARNGIVHDDRGVIAAVRAEGWPLQLATVRRWRNVVDETATIMDHELSRDIAELIGRNPWR